MALQSARFRGKPRFDKIHNYDTTAYFRVNDQGDDVRELQNGLLDLGYSIPSGATGFFGAETSTAVVRFKTDHGLHPNDPVAGRETITTLDGYYAVPFADREEWLSWQNRRLPAFNYTRQDEFNRINTGATLTWNPASAWIPPLFKDALVKGISQILDPYGSPVSGYAPSATWGVSPLDLYHCHLVIDGIPVQIIDGVPRRDPAPAPWNDIELRDLNLARIRDQCRAKADAVADPGTPAWIANYRSALLAPAPAGQRSYTENAADLLNLIAAASAAPATARPVYMLWHSFEERLWRPPGMRHSDPRRHWWCEATPNLSAVTAAPNNVEPKNGYSIIFNNLCFVIDKAGLITAVAGAAMDEIATVVNLDLLEYSKATQGLP
ncbi:hypothetical protein A5740_12720 [Mycobacterium sp. GA-1841]|uniref:peptidoglycan-binding domain-containing protein n=1 Tax=Mycobacterium sp. GA-1841 TaxID=1834154 RepID=UPI00096E8DEF|nr:peptidoglycan-binding protein [Mycobacterium sp. GA-1841]OMC32538.1 hypothetical protein A5740_12720 [Mycobacterium sp. GA-1841]